MGSVLKFSFYCMLFVLCVGSYHEQYRVPQVSSDKLESYIFNDREYLIQNLAVNWENSKILCRLSANATISPCNKQLLRYIYWDEIPYGGLGGDSHLETNVRLKPGHHNGTLAVLDSRDKAEFLAEALSESQLSVESVWIGARRDSAEDPAGYRWSHGVELRRTAMDVLKSDRDGNIGRHFPAWLNRTHVPVPEGGADCVAIERVHHDRPVFVDLPCNVERPFVCERAARLEVRVTELKTIRCKTGLYHIYDGRLNWHQAAANCVLRKMSLANIATMKCLKKLGLSMLKTRPSIENAWVGATGSLGKWSWIDTGLSIFQPPFTLDVRAELWPPMRDRATIKQSGCLQLDRHEAHPPVFMEARCERKMQFICYQGLQVLKSSAAPTSDDLYYYVLVRQLLYWQHAYENCQKMNGSLATLENNDVLIQLLLLMGENKEDPITHIWVSGRLNMTKDVSSDSITYGWYNPTNGKRIPDQKAYTDTSIGLYMPPWLDEEYMTDSSCLNLDRQDHLNGLVYGLPCDTPQYSICMIEKTISRPATENSTEGYDTS